MLSSDFIFTLCEKVGLLWLLYEKFSCLMRGGGMEDICVVVVWVGEEIIWFWK